METLDVVEAISIMYSSYKRQKSKQKITTEKKYWTHKYEMDQQRPGSS